MPGMKVIAISEAALQQLDNAAEVLGLSQAEALERAVQALQQTVVADDELLPRQRQFIAQRLATLDPADTVSAETAISEARARLRAR